MLRRESRFIYSGEQRAQSSAGFSEYVLPACKAPQKNRKDSLSGLKIQYESGKVDNTMTEMNSSAPAWRRGLTRNVVILGCVSLLNDGASEMIYPLLPTFLTAVLGAGPEAVGVVEGTAEATASLLKLTNA